MVEYTAGKRINKKAAHQDGLMLDSRTYQLSRFPTRGILPATKYAKKADSSSKGGGWRPVPGPHLRVSCKATKFQSYKQMLSTSKAQRKNFKRRANLLYKLRRKGIEADTKRATIYIPYGSDPFAHVQAKRLHTEFFFKIQFIIT